MSSTKQYPELLSVLKEKIKQAQVRAVLSVNAELLGIYHEIGNAIYEQEKERGWGSKVISRLSEDLQTAFPEMKGFSPRNLRYMRDFYIAYPFLIWQQPVAKLPDSTVSTNSLDKYPENEHLAIWQQLVAKLPWGYHILLIGRDLDLEERLFYMRKCLENNWSREVFRVQIETQLHKRIGKAINNFADTLPVPESELAMAAFKNPYFFDFLQVMEQMKERELQSALIEHLKKFIMELGKGFAYVGCQYRLTVDGDVIILDLLFYNIPLHSYVVFELKIVDFEPEFAGKLNFYVNVVDDQLRGPKDGPTIGVLLCRTPNTTSVKYALRGMVNPIGVAEYHLAEALPAELEIGMPTVEELEAEIAKGLEELKSPLELKVDQVKDKIQALKLDPKVVEKRKRIRLKILDLVADQVFNLVLEGFSEAAVDFRSVGQSISIAGTPFNSLTTASEFLSRSADVSAIVIRYEFKSFQPAGNAAFDIHEEVTIRFGEADYEILVGDASTRSPLVLVCSVENEVSPATSQRIVENLLESLWSQMDHHLDEVLNS